MRCRDVTAIQVPESLDTQRSITMITNYNDTWRHIKHLLAMHNDAVRIKEVEAHAQQCADTIHSALLFMAFFTETG